MRMNISFRRQGDAEVAEHVAPDGVNVVGAVLGIVELDQEGWALNAIGVRLGTIRGARPGELDPFGAGLADLVEPGLGDFDGHIRGVRFDQGAQQLALVACQVGKSDSGAESVGG